MDRGYDRAVAQIRLEELALERYNSAHSGVQLSRIVSVTAHYEAVSVGRAWNLVHKNTNEELVVSFQGIIVKKDLPPFLEKIGRASHHVKYLRQSVSVAGFESATFAKVVNATAGVHAVLSRSVGISSVLDCGMIGSISSVTAIELSNRYFRARKSGADGNDEVVLSSDIDPYGYLCSAAANLGLYHSEENVVQYYQREGSGDESYRYTNMKPLIFGIGDIVEIQALFVMYPLSNGKYKSGMVLRGLTLLDGTFTQARMKTMAVCKLPVSLPTIIKRKVGYSEEEMSVTRAKLARMDVDNHPAVEVGCSGVVESSSAFEGCSVSDSVGNVGRKSELD